MLGDMMKNMEEQQQAMQAKLQEIPVVIEKNGIKIEANAARQVSNISIDSSLLKDQEQLEDLMIVAINEMQIAIAAKESEASQEMMNNMLPGGLAGLGGLFS